MENSFKKIFKRCASAKKKLFYKNDLSSLVFLNSVLEFKKDFFNFICVDIEKNKGSSLNFNQLELEVFRYFCFSNEVEDFVSLFNEFRMGENVLKLIQSTDFNSVPGSFNCLTLWKNEKAEKDSVDFSNKTHSSRAATRDCNVRYVENEITDLMVKKSVYYLTSYFNQKTNNIIDEVLDKNKSKKLNLDKLSFVFDKLNEKFNGFLENIFFSDKKKDSTYSNEIRRVGIEESRFLVYFYLFKLKSSVDILNRCNNNFYFFSDDFKKNKEKVFVFFSTTLNETKNLNLNKVFLNKEECFVAGVDISLQNNKNTLDYLGEKFYSDFFVNWTNTVSKNRNVFFFQELDCLALEIWKNSKEHSFNWIANRNYYLEEHYLNNPKKCLSVFSLDEKENITGLNWIRAESETIHKFDVGVRIGAFRYNGFKEKTIDLRCRAWVSLVKNNPRLEEKAYAFFTDYFLNHLKSITIKESVYGLLKEDAFSWQATGRFEAINLDNYNLLPVTLSDILSNSKFFCSFDEGDGFNFKAIKEIERINQDYIFFTNKEMDNLKKDPRTDDYDLDKFFLTETIKRLLVFQHLLFSSLKKEEKISLLNEENEWSFIVFDKKIKEVADKNFNLFSQKTLSPKQHVMKDKIKKFKDGWLLSQSREATFKEIEKAKIINSIGVSDKNNQKQTNKIFRF